ncbi:TonB-dependent receptor [Candidatus Neomarinimicrobiota bacterium]
MSRMQQVSTLFLVIMILSMMSPLHAQAGNINGRIVDIQSGEYLPGANVMLEGTSYGGTTDREGIFWVSNIPSGDYTLLVRYIGYEDNRSDISITSGSISTTTDIKMSPSYVEMEDVVVEGIRQGQMKALSMQRESNKIKNVVSRELMEQFPDANTAEVLQRLPGVYIDRAQGQGRYVMIRGTEPRLSTITVNGEALSSSRNEQRYSQLDVVGSNQMSFIEVVKAITPDMSANSIGGAVNLITRSAFDYPGHKLKLTLGSGYTNHDGQPIYQGQLNYSNRFGKNQNMGISLIANFDRKNTSHDNMEYEYDEVEDVNDNVIPYALTNIFMHDVEHTKDIIGYGGAFEYRPNDDHRFFVNAMWNKLSDDMHRHRIRIRVDKGDYLNPEGTLTEKSRMVRESSWRIEDLLQSHYTFGGESRFGNNTLDYTFGYSEAGEEHLPSIQTDWEFDEKVNLALDLTDPAYPTWEYTNIDPELVNDGSLWETDAVDYRNERANENNMVGGFNFEMPRNLFGLPSKIKVGVKYTKATKDRNNDRYDYQWDGDDDATLDQFESDRVRDDFMNDHYEMPPGLDYEEIQDWIENNKGDFDIELDYSDSEGATYKIDESVMAYYAMVSLNIRKSTLVGGFRHELTQNDLEGTELIYDDDGDFSSFKSVNLDKKYNKIFPMIHFIYDLTANTKLRLALTTAMSRPNYYDLAPKNEIDYRRERIRAGNPDLKPTTATNIDLMAEHYLSGIGTVSASMFYKDLKDIIFERKDELDEGAWAGFEIEHAVNGGKATLYGFELNWQQELTFLPGLLSGFGLYANYTHTWAEAELTDRSGYLPGQAGDAGNLALSYEHGPFNARLSYAYQGKYIEEVGKDKDHDEYSNDHEQLDFTGTYKATKNLSLYVDMVNITNQPKYDYMGIYDRPISISYYSWSTRIGLKYSL